MKRFWLVLVCLAVAVPSEVAAKDLSGTFLDGFNRRNTVDRPQWLSFSCSWSSDPVHGFQTPNPREDRTWCEFTWTTLLRVPSGVLPIVVRHDPWEPFVKGVNGVWERRWELKPGMMNDAYEGVYLCYGASIVERLTPDSYGQPIFSQTRYEPPKCKAWNAANGGGTVLYGPNLTGEWLNAFRTDTSYAPSTWSL